jgi:phosphoglycolate phosphatase-like HAD superfamily hydrolase
MKKNKKLVLFDVDGTLLISDHKGVEYWKKRLHAVFETVHQTPIPFELNIHDFNGMVDKQVMWKVAQMLSISKEKFEAKSREMNKVFHEYLKLAVKNREVGYWPIEDAKKLLDKMVTHQYPYYGLVTGNVESNAWLKLRSAGLDSYFSFGAFGDTVSSRSELVRYAITTAPKHFGATFDASEVIVIGDTVHDIQAAKDAGAIAIGVATGFTSSEKDLKNAGADIVATSLLDDRIIALMGLDV